MSGWKVKSAPMTDREVARTTVKPEPPCEVEEVVGVYSGGSMIEFESKHPLTEEQKREITEAAAKGRPLPEWARGMPMRAKGSISLQTWLKLAVLAASTGGFVVGLWLWAGGAEGVFLGVGTLVLILSVAALRRKDD